MELKISSGVVRDYHFTLAEVTEILSRTTNESGANGVLHFVDGGVFIRFVREVKPVSKDLPAKEDKHG